MPFPALSAAFGNTCSYTQREPTASRIRPSILVEKPFESNRNKSTVSGMPGKNNPRKADVVMLLSDEAELKAKRNW